MGATHYRGADSQRINDRELRKGSVPNAALLAVGFLRLVPRYGKRRRNSQATSSPMMNAFIRNSSTSHQGFVQCFRY